MIRYHLKEIWQEIFFNVKWFFAGEFLGVPNLFWYLILFPYLKISHFYFKLINKINRETENEKDL